MNPHIASMFKGKVPDSLDEVGTLYTDFFKQLDKSRATPPAPAPVTRQRRQRRHAKDPNLQELKDAPFREAFLQELTTSEDAGKLLPQKAGNRYEQLLSAVSKVELTHPGAPKRAMVVEDAPKPINSPVFIRGEAQNKGDIVPRRFLEILSGPNRPEFKNGSGRLELAQAIAVAHQSAHRARDGQPHLAAPFRRRVRHHAR